MEVASARDSQLVRPLPAASPMTLQELLSATAAALWDAGNQRLWTVAAFLIGLFSAALHPICNLPVHARVAAGIALRDAAAVASSICARASRHLSLFVAALVACALRYSGVVVAPIRHAVRACVGHCSARISSEGPAAGAPESRRRLTRRPPGALVRPKPQPARIRYLRVTIATVSAVACLVAVCAFATHARLHWGDVIDDKLSYGPSGVPQPLSH